jgi:hypothetical protein
MRPKGSKNKPKATEPPKRKYPKRPVRDNETEMLAIILQSINSMSEMGKARTMVYLNSKYENYLPNK